MSTQLIHIYRIAEHPIKYLPDSIKERYLAGLACVLYNMSDGNGTMKVLFEQWAYSIMGCDMSHLFLKHDAKSVSEALSLNRVGLRFFRCKHEFFFDCFYLTEAYNKALLPRLQEHLNVVGKNIFTKSALQQMGMFYSGSMDTVKVSKELLEHRIGNLSYKAKRSHEILVVATVSAGKSTLINALLGYDFNRVRTTACTSRICRIYNKPVDDGITYRKEDMLFYDSDIESRHSDETSETGLHFQSLLGDYKVCLIDTPGVNNSMDVEHWEITTEAIKEGHYDSIIFISNSQYNGTTDERHILDFIHSNCKKPVLFVLNQLDCFKPSVDDIKSMLSDYKKELSTIGFKNPMLYPLSAQYAYLLGKKGDLDEDDKFELESLNKRFLKDFYDLPSYIGEKSIEGLERSGVVSLQNAIINQILK